jgi:hypothetical protein
MSKTTVTISKDTLDRLLMMAADGGKAKKPAPKRKRAAGGKSAKLPGKHGAGAKSPVKRKRAAETTVKEGRVGKTKDEAPDRFAAFIKKYHQ